MNNILDHVEVKKEHRKVFSKLSFSVAVNTLSLSIYLFIQFPSTLNVNENIPSSIDVIAITINISCLIGMIITILSFYRSEPSTWMKWIGGLINVSLFILILGVILFESIG